MGFTRQEYWSGLPFPSPGDLPDPGIEPGSPALQTDTLLSEPPKVPYKYKVRITVFYCTESESCIQLFGLYSPWNSPGQNTGVSSLSLLQGIFPTQGSNPGLRISGGFFTS